MKTITVPQASISLTRLGVLLPALVLAACSTPNPVGPDYKEPQTSLPSNYRFEIRKNGRSAAQRDRWWTLFNDNGLNRLLEQVRASNQELRSGLARVEQARATLRLSAADTVPDVSTSPSITRNRTSSEVFSGGRTYNLFSAPVNASWEIDLFGGIRRNLEALTADAQASEEALNSLRLSLEAEAAAGYFNLRALDREIDIVREGVETRQNSLQLAQDRFDLGAVSQLDVSRAKSELATSEADLASLRRQRTTQETALATLAGKPASSFTIPHSPLTGSPPAIPASVPSELLRARPDIRSAERQIAAANARIGVATAAFYPSVSLTGNLGVQSYQLDQLLNLDAQYWSIGPQVYLPLFDGGRNQANLDISRAQYEEVLADYQQTVLESLAEVEARLAATRQLAIQDMAQKEAVKAAQAARDTAHDQYNGGISDYLSVLDAERTALNAERAQALLIGSEFVNAVNLIRALGGRW
ncbi:MAG: efflux transporter outer membrane subunit [Verrucomicrobiota bacterium JB023]|nr:efflux transporter outer membrane subunit [Verrucomicrobiota bacterium JB023]